MPPMFLQFQMTVVVLQRTQPYHCRKLPFTLLLQHLYSYQGKSLLPLTYQRKILAILKQKNDPKYFPEGVCACGNYRNSKKPVILHGL